MDPDKDIAEERLLRVIEKGQSRSKSVALGSRHGVNLFQIIRGWLVRFYSRPIGRDSDPVLRALRIVSMVLWIAMACFGIYFAKDMLSFNRGAAQKKIFDDRLHAGKPTTEPSDEGLGKLKDENYYTDAVKNPNPFTGATEEVKVVEQVKTESPSDKLNEMAKTLVVVGINRGTVPDAIVEDSAQKRTFFVKVGDKINEMTVKEIRHDTLVVSFDGADLEIG